uniref:Uncharacterized protein n=1 Tax=Rhizophora mucronata TaxID=61149 RepID=A0A2P2PHN3_RHIMU
MQSGASSAKSEKSVKNDVVAG